MLLADRIGRNGSTYLALGLLIVISIIPFNNVVDTAFVGTLRLLVILFGFAYLLRVHFGDRILAHGGVFATIILLIFATIFTAPERIPSLVMLVSGFYIGFRAGKSALVERTAFSIAILLAFSLLYELVTLTPMVELLGQSHAVTYVSGSDIRAKGLLGHPLLTSYAAIWMSWTSFLSRLERGVEPRGMSHAVVAIVAALASGSRSSIVLAIFLYGCCAVILAFRRGNSWSRIAASLFRGIVLVVSATLLVLFLSSRGLRALSFDSIVGSSSYSVRAGTIDIWRVMDAGFPCNFGCELVGRGFRSATAAFLGNEPAIGVRTFDNIYATALFDLGVFGIIVTLLIPLSVVAVGRGFGAFRWITSVALVGVGFVYDSYYSFAVVAFLGTFYGIAFRSDSFGRMHVDLEKRLAVING